MQPAVEATLEDARVIVIGHVKREAVDRIVGHDPAVPIIDLQGIQRIEEARNQNYWGICW